MPDCKIKVIQLESTDVDNSQQYPYVIACSEQTILFSLRTNKTYHLKPILLIDTQRHHSPILPLKKKDNISDQCIKTNCFVLEGQFTEDGEWISTFVPKKPGLINFQLVFTKYGSDSIQQVGSFDTILLVQQKIQLRKLRKQTLFPRCIGNANGWIQFLKKQVDLGYNSFHFAPIQETGASRSYYSIHNQLELSSDVFNGNHEQKYNELRGILTRFQKQGVVFFVDIVLNHTSFDSDWIKDRKDAVFTTQNTPQLESAFQLDVALREWGYDIKKSYASEGQEDHILTPQQFAQIQVSLRSLVESLNLQEYFEIPIQIASEFLERVPPRETSDNIFAKDPCEIVIEFIERNVVSLGQKRKGVYVSNLQSWREMNPAYSERDLLLGIQKYNDKWRKTFKNQWEPEIIKNIIQEIRYHYLDNQYRSFNSHHPFVNQYFSQVKLRDGSNIFALNNGWVMNAETTEHIVTTKHFYYLRRKVSVWGDLIRIRYGNCRNQSSAWEWMEQYVEKMAQYFDGFRLDNLHGTPLPVARHFINHARKIKPQIIIFAELFTNSDSQTAMFCRQGGINSTIFQIKYKLSGKNFIDLFHQVMGNHGKYTGSLNPCFHKYALSAKYCKRKRPVPLVYDLTHDNSTYQSRGKTILKTPISLLLQLCGAFIGSTKGFDQFYSHKIQVTQLGALYLQDFETPPQVVQNEKFRKRICFKTDKKSNEVELFGSWDNWKESIKMKDSDNDFKYYDLELAPGHYEYKFKFNGEWVTDSPRQINKNGNHQFTIGKYDEIKYSNLEGLRKKTKNYRQKFFSYKEYYGQADGDLVILVREDQSYENSICVIANLSLKPQIFSKKIQLPGFMVRSDVWVQSDYSLYEGATTSVEITNHENIFAYLDHYHRYEDGKDILFGTQIPPGFACLIQCKKNEKSCQAIRAIKQLRAQPIKLPPLGGLDYNFIMYGIDQQEAVKYGSSNYFLPKSNRKLLFAGFGGILKDIQNAKKYNNLSLDLFDNLRQENWLLDYYIGRISKLKHLRQFTEIVCRYFENLKNLPAYLKPKFFTSFIYDLCYQIQQQASNNKTSQFRRKLQLASNQFVTKFDNVNNNLFSISMSAGLPHFSTGWMRSWGRDTFMANQLLLLHPNLYRDIIIQFAATLRHGLIPNLLDFGNNPRYNCRDACWWFIRGVKEYANHTKDYEIFKTKVQMLFLSDDQQEHNEGKQRKQTRVMLMEDIIQSIFQSHANGISFREWNAGIQIDSNMSSQGFHIKLNVDEDTGFIVGGNSFNCLTWMDKMGSSEKADNKGYPATPRAGSPIELTGLLYHCLKSYHQLFKAGHYTHNGVQFKKRTISYEYWAQMIKENFQKAYYIDQDCPQTKYSHIYKDVINGPEKIFYQEYRLRPNALVALALSPQLFIPQHALNYLQKVQQQLIHDNSIGVATLGSAHQSLFVPYYNNNDDSSDLRTAHGFSYHNGPEWVWPYGFYVAAKCIFQRNMSKQRLYGLVQNQCKYLLEDSWGSLPQLTDRNGKYNDFSCPSQAWSISSMILAIDQIQTYQT